MDDETRQVVRRIGDHVTRIQRRRGLSDAALAERSGVALAVVERLRRGESDPGMHSIYRLAGALEVRPGDLLQGIEWIPGEDGGGRFSLDREERR